MKAIFRKAIDPLVHLFWKTQISILCACPPLLGFFTEFSMGSATSPWVWIRTLALLAVKIPRAILLHWRNKLKKRVVLPRLQFAVTTRCTLNCDKCVAHIPDLKNQADVPLDTLAHDIQALLACVDHIYVVELTGGEAFLHPHLDEIIRLLADSGKIGHIRVLTNGTILPTEQVLAALSEAKATVQISKYSEALQPNAEKLKELLQSHNIPFICQGSKFWRDTGALEQLQEGSAQRRFGICALRLCLMCFSGKLYRCGKTTILTEKGIISDCEGDYIDFHAIDSGAFGTQWKNLRKKRVLSACSYCLGCTCKSPQIPIAEQR